MENGKGFYLNFHEKYVEGALISLLKQIENDFENVDQAIQWAAKRLNIKLYKYENTEDLLVSIPNRVDKDEIRTYFS